MKKVKQVYFSILILAFIGFIVYGFIFNQKGHKRWIEQSYHGIIEGIFPNDYQFGDPQIRLENNNLIQLGGREEMIFNYIQIGDSIVKPSGSEVISVFRKDENGKWVEKQFDCSEKTVRM